MKTRLETACNALGWQGGTVHQVNDILFRALGKKLDINQMSDLDFHWYCCCFKVLDHEKWDTTNNRKGNKS